MLYPDANKPLSREVFANPGSAYRGTPFWSWNCELTEDMLARGIDMLKKMGFGGFHIHVRTGMSTPYLTDSFFRLIRFCVEQARQKDMLVWLYDEDRWPSGAAGGLVTKDPAFRARHLLFTRKPYDACDRIATAAKGSSAVPLRTGNGKLLARYDIRLDAAGDLASYRKLGENETPEGFVCYAYLETAAENPWFNNQTYVDTLNPAAIRRFLDVTHERYLQAVGQDFGGVIPAIFTDEPQFTHKTVLAFADSAADVILPWTDDLPDTFSEAYAENLLDCLPELFWELPGGRVSTVRYHYHDHIAERFARSFADQVGEWCRSHGIMLTGHMMEEPTLESQTKALGEAMRSLRGFDLPGIDMLCNRHEYTTAKQAQSAANQNGNSGVLSELYGVTNWDYDFRGHKLQGDWQAALGVTVRVPHLTWLSMAGEAKRDYPAAIGHQSPWHLQYPYVDDHFARVNVALTRGRPLVRVAVVHPVESYWLHFGSNERTRLSREQKDRDFLALTEWLLFGQIDFDFISESMLPGQCPAGGSPLQVGKMAYDTVVVPPVETLRATTLDRLEAFASRGGRLLFLGEAPSLCDARPSDRGCALWNRSKRLPCQRLALLEALEPCRDIDVRDDDGTRAEDLLYRMRQEEDGTRWLFLAHGKDPEQPDIVHPRILRIRLKGRMQAERWDTQEGTVSRMPVQTDGGWTLLETAWYEHDALLLRLEPFGGSDAGPTRTEPVRVPYQLPRRIGNKYLGGETRIRFGERVKVTLEESNVALLDLPEVSLDGGGWEPREEILRADNRLRSRLGWPTREESVAQPWTLKPEKPAHSVQLRFRFRCVTALRGVKLGLEDADKARIRLDGKKVRKSPDGYYVDESIGTVPLPTLTKGNHVLVIRLPFGRKTNLEACYLLGSFGVKVRGCDITLGKPVRRLSFGDIGPQGLPFYGGNLVYHLDVQTSGKNAVLRVPRYRGAMVDATVDGKAAGRIVYSPYELLLHDLKPGWHRMDLRVYGTRYNTFAQLHNADDTMEWFGPNAWRTVGDAWSYEYRLKPAGILKSPELYEPRA